MNTLAEKRPEQRTLKEVAKRYSKHIPSMVQLMDKLGIEKKYCLDDGKVMRVLDPADLDLLERWNSKEDYYESTAKFLARERMIK